MTSTSASIRRKYMYWIKSFLIWMLFSSTWATVNSLNLHFCHNLFFLSRNTISSSRPPSDMIHHKSIVPVCTSVFESTGQLSIPFVKINANSFWFINRNISWKKFKKIIKFSVKFKFFDTHWQMKKDWVCHRLVWLYWVF